MEGSLRATVFRGATEHRAGAASCRWDVGRHRGGGFGGPVAKQFNGCLDINTRVEGKPDSGRCQGSTEDREDNDHVVSRM